MVDVRRMFLNGTAMSGQKDHHAIAGARFLGPALTAPRYRFYAVRDEFPGLLPATTGGVPVEGELYEVSERILFESLLPEEPPELELGTIELSDGQIVNSMHLQPERIRAADKVVDISDHGGWRAYLSSLAAAASEPSPPPRAERPRARVLAAPDPDVLTDAALDLIGVLERVHGPARRALLSRRAERAAAIAAGATIQPDPATAPVRELDWTVAPPPPHLRRRRVEITGPVDRKMMIGALNSGADVFMADLEDALSPTWANIVSGHRNLRDAACGSLTFRRPDGTVDSVGPEPATLVVRPRGLHLDEPRVTVDGVAPSASLFDIALLGVHCARALQARGDGLALYLPKLESYHEAEWWDAVLADLERRLGLPSASIRVTVLIETITAALEMDEILWSLRERVTGLNAGRWDYLFSIIKRFGTRPEALLPDRQTVTMSVPFMAAYAERLVATCHRRGAYAIGGMAAFVPNRRDAEATARALAAVADDKAREARLGYDGTWVAHPDLVPIAATEFAAVLGERDNQLEAIPRDVAPLEALLDFAVPQGSITGAGLERNVDVALAYLAAWLDGRGAVAINDLMEDAATAEIARSQLWQWVLHGAALDDGRVVTAEMVDAAIDAASQRLLDSGAGPREVKTAAELLRQVSLSPQLPEFLTVAALELLGDGEG